MHRPSLGDESGPLILNLTRMPTGLCHGGGRAGTAGTPPRIVATPVGLVEMWIWIPKVAACRRNLGLWDGIPMGLEEKFWSAAIGHELSEPGWQLEQQREQLPRREPQQHRVSHCLQLRPTKWDGTMCMGLNRPPSRSHPVSGCDKSRNRPPGTGSPVDAGSKAAGTAFC